MRRAPLAPSGLLHHLGSGRVFSVWVWVVQMPFAVAILGGFDDATSDAERATGLGIAVGTHFCIGLLMVGGGAIERTIALPRARAAAVLAYAALLGTVRPFLIDGAQELLGQQLYAGALGTRVATNVLVSVVSITLISLLVDSLRQHAAARARLRAVLDTVNESRLDDESALDEMMHRLRLNAAELIGLALRRERPSQWDAAAEADALRRVSDEVVRPLSHLAFESARPAASARGRSGDGQGGEGAAPSSALLSRVDFLTLDLRPRRVWLAPAVYSSLFLPYLLTHFAPATGALFTAVGVATATAGDTLIRAWLPPTTSARTRAVVVVGYIGVGAFIALSSIAIAFLAGWPRPSVALHLVAYPTVALTLAACQSSLHQLRERHHALAEALAGADRAAAAARSRLVFAREQLARLLHTGVQGELIAVSLRVRRGEADAAAVDTAVSAIQRTLTMHGDEEQREASAFTADAARQSAERLLGAWGTALRIDADVDPAVWDRLAGDKHLASVTLDVVSEALSNVMRHASSPEATLRARCEAGSLCITVLSPGILGDSRTGGYGLADLRGRVAELTLAQNGQLVVLTARIG